MDRQKVPAFLALMLTMGVVLGMCGECTVHLGARITSQMVDGGHSPQGDL